MAKYVRRFRSLSEAADWAFHLAGFEGVRQTLKRQQENWVLTFEHPQFRGDLHLNPRGVWLSSGMTRSIYTRTGRTYAATWQGLLTFDGRWIDHTLRSAA